MNLQVLLTILRQILLALGTYLTTAGLIEGSVVEPITGGVLAAISAIWGIYAKQKDQDTIKASK
jgi:hypothetical protein